MCIDRNTNTSSLARSFHSAQGLPVRARRQGQDRQELPSVLDLFHFRVFLRAPAPLRETQAFLSPARYAQLKACLYLSAPQAGQRAQRGTT